MTLHQHLGDTGCTAEVTIYLERWMRIEEIAIGSTFLLVQSVGEEVVIGQGQLVMNQLISVITIQKTSPETNLPSHRPTCTRVATMYERSTGCIEEFRSLLRCNLITWIERIEMTYMTMIILRIVPVLDPFLQLSPLANLHRCHLSQHFLQMSSISGIFAQDFARSDNGREEFVEQFIIHRSAIAHGYLSILGRMYILRTHSWRNHEPSMLWFRYQHLIKKGSCTLHDKISLAQEFLVTTIKIMLPEMG